MSKPVPILDIHAFPHPFSIIVLRQTWFNIPKMFALTRGPVIIVAGNLAATPLMPSCA